MKYSYYVAYQYTANEGRVSGFGWVVQHYDTKITTFEQIKEMHECVKKAIDEDERVKNAVPIVVNFTLINECSRGAE